MQVKTGNGAGPFFVSRGSGIMKPPFLDNSIKDTPDLPTYALGKDIRRYGNAGWLQTPLEVDCVAD
jgi:hypothetical protein